MRFVHIIQINDPLNPLIEPMTREQLWSGLLRRVEHPIEFLPQLTDSSIVARADRTLARELNFGNYSVRDRVRLEPLQRVTIETEANGDIPAGSLVMTIEEPGTLLLQVRFSYQIQRPALEDAATQKMYEDFTKSAYLEADIDCIKLIRLLVSKST